jgi:hypothetical protein
MAKLNELPIPPAALEDKNAQEMLRAWAAKKKLNCSINVFAWGKGKDAPIGWGIVLADVARHVADALVVETGADRAASIQEIRRVFNDELDSPTSDTSGSFVD